MIQALNQTTLEIMNTARDSVVIGTGTIAILKFCPLIKEIVYLFPHYLPFATLNNVLLGSTLIAIANLTHRIAANILNNLSFFNNQKNLSQLIAYIIDFSVLAQSCVVAISLFEVELATVIIIAITARLIQPIYYLLFPESHSHHTKTSQSPNQRW